MRSGFSAVTIVASIVTSGLVAGLWPSPAFSETPEWFTCPDSSAFKFRRDAEVGALNARQQQPSAGSKTSADLAMHARLATMSYDMYDAFSTGADPLKALPPRLKPIALVYGDPGRTERARRRIARDTRTFYGVVADDPSTGKRLIVLRGTLQPNEWMRNLQARLRPFLRSRIRSPFPRATRRLLGGARVHNGFMRIYTSLELRVVSGNARVPFSAGLKDLVANRTVTFVGHSLGGALATLAGVEAALLTPHDGQRARVVTLGSPRVGNAGFARLAQNVGRIDRVCNLVDVVPAVPPSTRLTPYVHVGNVFRVSSFDWPALENQNLTTGEQVTCWHSIHAYAFMTAPNKNAPEGLEACLSSDAG